MGVELLPPAVASVIEAHLRPLAPTVAPAFEAPIAVMSLPVSSRRFGGSL